MDRETNDRFASALVDLANTLDEWKDAGGDSLTVVGAIQKFVAVQMQLPADGKKLFHKLEENGFEPHGKKPVLP